jgi:UDP-glucose 6-dehydrogenase
MKPSFSISVLGMGYVGCVTAACLAEEGHHVIAVDVSEDKVKALSEGKTPVEEPGLEGSTSPWSHCGSA